MKYTAIVNFKQKHIDNKTCPSNCSIHQLMFQGREIEITNCHNGIHDYRSTNKFGWVWKKKWLKDIKPIIDEKILDKAQEALECIGHKKTTRKYLWAEKSSTGAWLTYQYYLSEEEMEARIVKQRKNPEDFARTNCWIEV